jgi:hypothetical protein
VGGDGLRVQLEVGDGIGPYLGSCVEEDLERLTARVLGEKGGTLGDAEPVLADGAESEDGLGRQADEDIGDEALVEVKIVFSAHLIDRASLLMKLIPRFPY